MTQAQFSSGESIRFGVSVRWNKYPNHTTRQIILTCGKLSLMNELFTPESRIKAIGFINVYLDDETAADYIKSLPEVR